MNNRLSFTQILAQKQSTSQSRISHLSDQSQPSLSDYMQEYLAYPDQDYTLRFGESNGEEIEMSGEF